MNPRIIQGKYKGRKLTVANNITRPYTDRVKKTLFDIIKWDLSGKSILDLFAGSGGMGLEALSLEAKSVVFVDSNIEAISAIKSNVMQLGVESECEIIHSDYNKFIKKNVKKFDIIFCDPPFRIAKSVKFPFLTSVMDANSLLIFRSDIEVENLLVDFNIIDKRRIGINYLYFLKIR